jgi:hypothetical protein
MVMRIAYASSDEVNLALAREMAAECGAVVDDKAWDGGSRDDHHDARIYDLDHLPGQRHQEVLSELLSDGPSCPVAVHGYNLSDELAIGLQINGVDVFHRLDVDVFNSLRKRHAERVIRLASVDDGAGSARVEHVED